MTVAQAVVMRLKELTTVTDLVGQRIYKDILPQQPTLPAIRVQRISQLEPMQLRGTVGFNTARVQVDSIAVEKAEAEAVDRAVAGTVNSGSPNGPTGLTGWVGSVGSPAFEVMGTFPAGVGDMYDPDELRQFKVMRDYLITYRGE